jgi:molybdopterin-guanine dinucleotide biosynthesis protein A
MAMVAVVLAGGASRRMGEPKAGLELHGRPLLEHAVAAARAAGLEPVVLAKPGDPLPAVDAERWDEPAEPRHPLTGIIAALERAGPQGIVALACDTPFVRPALLDALAARTVTTLVRTPDGRLHPLPGRYADAAALRAPLAAGAPLVRTLIDLGAAVLDEPDAASLLNVNRPGDLERAARVLDGLGAPGRAE